jgi:hypothetical protein
MSTVWRARLKELLEANDAVHNAAAALREAPTNGTFGGGVGVGEKPRTRENLTAKTAKTPAEDSRFSENAQPLAAKTAKTSDSTPPKRESTDLLEFARRRLEQASELGLVAIWSRHFGFVSVHDPTTGEWHDLSTEDAPGWAVREARKHKRDKAYPPTARQVEARREDEREHAPHPAVTDKGIVFEDYIEET